MVPLRLATALVVLVVAIVTAGHQDVDILSDGSAPNVLLGVEEGVGGIDVNVDGKGKAPSKKLGYDSIPGFVLRHMGQEQTTSTQVDCEALCDKEPTCRSYSFNPKIHNCVWSIETIRYRSGWEFWTKVHDLDAFGKLRHYGKYRSFPDIMYQEPGYAKYKQITVKNCQKHCNKDKKCKAFSYQLARKRCYLADSGIHYDPDYQYFERRGMKPRRNAMDVEDYQESLQQDEIAAKKAKRKRIIASINEREDKNQRTAQEMKSKSNVREASVKEGEKNMAEKRLAREKTLEAHDKRLARMKAVYNEGYFKAKGVAAEKKTKEKDIKGLRAKEVADKDTRKEVTQKQKNSKVTKERKRKKDRHEAKSRLLTAKEKLTKLKNQQMEMDIDKEERVLDVAKNLALDKASQHHEEVENEKEQKFHATMRKKKKIFELQHKVVIAKNSHKVEVNILKRLKRMTEDKQYDSDKYFNAKANTNSSKPGDGNTTSVAPAL